jgi:hypothetical protein
MIPALLFSRAGLAALALGAVFVFYEGVPIVKDIPFLRHVPLVGPFLDDLSHGRVDRAREAGAAEERVVWEEARKRLLAQIEQARRDAQAAIDAAEREYLARRAEDAIRISSLETAIMEMEADDTNPACPDRPAFPRGVSKSLDQVGR